MQSDQNYPVVVNVVYDPEDEISADVSNTLVAHFDKLGMERAGVHMRIPVRVRAERFDVAGALRPLKPQASRLDVLVVLHSYYMNLGTADSPWCTLIRTAEQCFESEGRPIATFFVSLEDDLPVPCAFSSAQTLRWFDWDGLSTARRTQRMMIHLANSVRRQLSGKDVGDPREPIFVSHAKADGKETAERVVHHINDPDNGFTLDTFYDARELEIGESWEAGLEMGVESGTVLALVTDQYDTRFWCNQEILWGKLHARPIVLVDLGRKRVGRTFPYGGNLPLISDGLTDDSGIETALLEVLSEALRCDLFIDLVRQRAGDDAIALPRPPELCDLAFLSGLDDEKPIIYPEPPVSDAELALLKRMASGRAIMSLGEAP